MNEQVRSVNWLQTNGVIYLPVVVKGATCVGGNVRRGLPANTTHLPDVGTMLCQRLRRWPNNVPALGERLLLASWKGTVLLYRAYRPAYQTRCLAYVYRYVFSLENLPLNLPLES